MRVRLDVSDETAVRAALGEHLTSEPADVLVVDDIAKIAGATIPVLLWAPGADATLLERAFTIGAVDVVDAARLAITVRRAVTWATRDDLQRAHEVTQKALASYQRHALQMEVIRQQNEDLDRLAAELARAKRASEERAGTLESAARLQSEFLASFSHEIRTPLNGILGYCDLLLREEGQRLTPSGQRDLTVVTQNANTLLALINDILDLSKMEAGRAEIVREEIDVQELVEECCGAVRETVRGRDVELLAAVRTTRAFTDSLKLKQILLNLLSNAAKFTDKGEIAVVVDAAQGNGNEHGTLRIVVQDTGAGIAPDQLPFVFDKFHQADLAATRKVGGTGLGLAIVREVTNLLGGTVDVRSILGRGTVFTVRIPGVVVTRPLSPVPLGPPPEEAMPPPPPSPPPQLPRARILYVEDSAQNRDIIRRFLSSKFDLSEAEDGEGGIERALRELPDLILMDLSLPRIDGWEATRRIKANPALQHIPVFAVSAHVGSDERTRARNVGCVEYLTKPIDQKHLVATIQKHLRPA